MSSNIETEIENDSDNESYTSMDEEEIEKNIQILKQKLKKHKKYQEVSVSWGKIINIYDTKQIKSLSNEEIDYIILHSEYDIYYRICKVIPKEFILRLNRSNNRKYFLIEYGRKIFTKHITEYPFIVGSYGSFDCFLENLIYDKYSLEELNTIFNRSVDTTWQYYYDIIYKKDYEKINIFSRNNIDIDPIDEKNKQNLIGYIINIIDCNYSLNIEYFIRMCVKYNHIINGNDLLNFIEFNDDYEIYYVVDPKNRYYNKKIEGQKLNKFIKIINSNVYDKSNPSPELIKLLERLNSIKPNIIKLDLHQFKYYFNLNLNNINYKDVFDTWNIKLELNENDFKLLENGVEIKEKFYNINSKEYLFFQELLKFKIF